MKKTLNIIDMFCGGGGESTGLISAANEYGFDVTMSAINHWERAIETHSANYPFAEHRCENVQHIDPTTLAASRNTDLLWASPGCQHFSVARGGSLERNARSKRTLDNYLSLPVSSFIECFANCFFVI